MTARRHVTTITAAASFAIALAGSVVAPAAVAQDLSSQDQSIVLLTVIAERGADCGLLRPWQAATLHSQIDDASKDWDAATRAVAAAATAEQAGETACDSPTLTVWIEGAHNGFEREYLPLFIIAYRVLAQDEPQLSLFRALSERGDVASDVATIDAKLTDLETSGVLAEGGKPWPDYIASMTGFVEGFAAMLRGQDSEIANDFSTDEAAAWIAQSVVISELWLADVETQAESDAEMDAEASAETSTPAE